VPYVLGCGLLLLLVFTGLINMEQEKLVMLLSHPSITPINHLRDEIWTFLFKGGNRTSISICATHYICLYEHSAHSYLQDILVFRSLPSFCHCPSPATALNLSGEQIWVTLGALHFALSKLILRSRRILRQSANTGKEQKHVKTLASSGLYNQEVKVFGNSIMELTSKFYLIFRCLWVPCGS